MKTRLGFVTNSSSSSFVIAKKNLTLAQYSAISEHVDYAKEHFGWDAGELDFWWSVDETGDELHGSVFMDNFDMYEFMEKIGVDMDSVSWRD